MSNKRARDKQKVEWNYEQYGCFGLYSCSNSLPIEFISTTFQIDELAKLSYAKDIRTELDFELLIQRDIDKKRAVEEISKYISPENGSGYGTIENNGVFLPPLVVAIVDTNDGKTLSQHYPDVETSILDDDYGKVFVREWPGLFKVSMFEQKKGANINFEHNNLTEEIEVDLKNTHVEFNIGHENEKGARLVVIDGQHRLFALNYLRHHDEHKEKVKNLIIPVCILYSPKSTLTNVKDTTPSIPDVLRKLFVDVNNNAKTVSGHFKILLSDDDVGKMTCSSLCTSLLDKGFLNGKSLSLVEWNTKTDKESKTISKPYSLSSIGVIYDTLTDLFKTRNGKSVLQYILRLEEISEKLDFGVDSDGETKIPSADFPWRDIPYNNKDDIKEQVSKYLTPCIKEIFFSTPFYKKFIDIFFEMRSSSLELLLKERSTDSLTAQSVIEYLDQFTELKDKASQQLFSSFVDEFVTKVNLNVPEIVRTNVFQKGVLSAWFSFISAMIEYNLRPIDATKIFIKVLQRSIDMRMFNNNIQNLYLQDSVFDGIKIKSTKESRKQISRLIISLLGNFELSKQIAEEINLIDGAVDIGAVSNTLQKLGENQATFYANSLHSQRIKDFTKGYRSNTDLSSLEIQTLIKFEEDKNETRKVKRRDSSVEIDQKFDYEVKKHINVDFALAIDQLSNLLGYTSVFDELLLDDNIEE